MKCLIILAVLRQSEQRVGGAHLRVNSPAGNRASFEEMLQRWPDVGNAVFDSTGSRLKSLTSRSVDERVTARPPGR